MFAAGKNLPEHPRTKHSPGGQATQRPSMIFWNLCTTIVILQMQHFLSPQRASLFAKNLSKKKQQDTAETLPLQTPG